MNIAQPLPRHGLVLAPAMLLLALSSAFAQGTISGRVSAQQGGEPLPESRITVVGTSLVGSTGPDGRYVIRTFRRVRGSSAFYASATRNRKSPPL